MKQASLYFVSKSTSRFSGDSKAGVRKKFLRGEIQFLFEFVNKVLLPHSEKCTVSSIVDLFLMETLSKFEMINLSALILEHLHKVLHVKDGKDGLFYG